MSDALKQAIIELEDYLRRYPSGRFSELAQLRLDRLLAQQGEKKVQLVSAADNPFTKGTAVANLNYRVGDRYKYQVIDLLTNIPGRLKVQTVTEVTADEVTYNRGGLITDVLGNFLRRGDGVRFGPSQYYATEYSVGKKWTTRYPIIFTNGDPDDVELDFKVVGREAVTVPAGTFDAFRVEGSGWILGKSVSLAVTYWVAPEKLARVIAIENWNRASAKKGKIKKADREELVAFAPAG